MATLTRMTIGRFGELFSGSSRTDIETILYRHDVPDAWVVGNNKLAMVMNVLRHLEEEGREDKILEIIRAVLPNLYQPYRREVERLLIQDGYAAENGQIIDADPEEQEYQVAVELYLDKYLDSFDSATLHHHLNECNNLFTQGRWDSSIAHCRNFVEQALHDIAAAIATHRSETPDLSRPVLVRNYLETIGFFEQNERRRLIDGVYGYFSEEGSHPGISTHSAARISKSMLLSFAFYLMEKFDLWKSGGFVLP